MSDATTGDLVMEQMANAGQLMCVYAGCFPPSDMMAFRIPRGVGGPMALAETSAAWKAGASALQEIQTQLREQTDALGEDVWRGDDRDAFETQLSKLLAEIGDSHNTAEAIGITLEVLSPAMAVWPPLCLTAGMAVAAVATAFYIAAASIIGDPGPAEAAYGTGLPIAEAMLSMLTVAEEVLIAALAVAEGVIAAAVFTDVEVQRGHGDSAIVGDLGQAEVDGLGQVAVNLAQYGVSRLLNKKPGEEGGAGEGAGTGEGGESTTPPETTPGPEDTTPPSTEPGPEDTTPPSTEPGPEDTTPPSTEPGPEDTTPPDGEPGDSTPPDGEHGDGDHEQTPAERGLERGRERIHELPKEAGKVGADTAQHQGAERTHAGSRLQDLINDKTGWEGTE